MCWVIPPASVAVTLVWRMASRSDVLPWSTCPITVTTGARGRSSAGSSTAPTSSTSSSGEARSTLNPNCWATLVIVSGSMAVLIVTSTPSLIRRLITGGAGRAGGSGLTSPAGGASLSGSPVSGGSASSGSTDDTYAGAAGASRAPRSGAGASATTGRGG